MTSPEMVAFHARIVFLVAAVTDGLALIPMLIPAVGAAMFRGGPARDTPQFRYAMNLAAALMAGWTVILFWAAASPMARLDILLIVVCPSIAGILWATAIAVRQGVLSGRRMVPLWIHLGLISAYSLIVYVSSRFTVS